MREILFKGKTIGDGAWVQGSLTIKYGYTILVFGYEWASNHAEFQIIPETACQYIGVKGFKSQKEHKEKSDEEVKLFENDIVEAWSEGVKGNFVIKFRNEGSPSYILFPAFQEGKFWKIHGSDLGRKKGDYYDDLRVIGNIHDK